MASYNPWEQTSYQKYPVTTDYRPQGGSIVTNTGTQSVPVKQSSVLGTSINKPTTTFEDLNKKTITNSSSTGTVANIAKPTQPGYSDISQSDLDATYNPMIEAANAKYNALQGQLPGYLQEIQTTGDIQKQPFDTRLKEGTQQLTEQEKATRDSEQSAISQARKLYNELSQSNLSRFGSGSSTGRAAMELLGRSTSGTIGEATNTSQKNVATIKDNLNKLQDYVVTQKSNIDKEVDSKKESAKRWFQDKLDEINSSKAMLESQKAQARYQALANKQAYINNLNNTQYNYENELYSWKQQQQANLEKALGASDLNPTPTTTDKFGNIVEKMVGTAPYVTNSTGEVGSPSEILGKYSTSRIIKSRKNPETGAIEYYNTVTRQPVNQSLLTQVK